MAYFLELLLNGALTGLMYSLVALGIVLIYKSSGVPNLAQGAMVMLAGYIVWLLSSWGIPVYLSIVLAILAMFVLGVLTERLLLRKMVGQPIIMIVMLTLGLEIFLRGVVPGFLWASPKQLNLGISFASVIIGCVFFNIFYLLVGVLFVVFIILLDIFFLKHW